MPTKQQHEQHRQGGDEERRAHSDDERRSWEKLSATVGGQVLQALGKPPGLQQVQVRPLWDAHHRVNVLVGDDIASVTIAKSYFVRTDATGAILASDPGIAKRY